jgi:UDP-N-acetylmuramate: L-alanyl-gamma-D-glutamyl-meso-diaminopimelate ligase
MKLGVHRDQLAPSLAAADVAWFLNGPELGWDLPAALAPMGARAHFAGTVEGLVEGLSAMVRPGDQILVMSNGGFGGLHAKLLAALGTRPDLGTRTAT